MHQVAVSTKRPLEQTDHDVKIEPAAKRVFPMFERTADTPTGLFAWKKSAHFLTKTCLYGENLVPQLKTKIAAFDLDGTIVDKVKGGEWRFWHEKVPHALKEVHDSGHTVVIISNQALREKELQKWKQKIPTIANALKEVPFIIFAATARDMYRKPMPGMWVVLDKMAQDAGVQIDKEKSFYVGDAAGRKRDFAGTDRKLAENLDLKFYTPEEYFLQQQPVKYELKGQHISETLKSLLPRVSPTCTPILPQSTKKPEMVVFVGYPASGKSTFFETTFRPADYAHVNQDTLGSRPKCIKGAEEYLQQGKSCVIDNTNRDKKTREHYIELAKKLDVPIRCFVFKSTIEQAWHNNLFRAYCRPLLGAKQPDGKAFDSKLVPYSAITSFAQGYEEPSTQEGFQEIKTVNFTFEGSPIEERFYRMWLQIDGK